MTQCDLTWLNMTERGWTWLNVTERDWTWLNITERHWTSLNVTKRKLNLTEYCWTVLIVMSENLELFPLWCKVIDDKCAAFVPSWIPMKGVQILNHWTYWNARAITRCHSIFWSISQIYIVSCFLYYDLNGFRVWFGGKKRVITLVNRMRHALHHN